MSTKERPILFSGPMVRAILAGRKTQTRRVLTIKHAKRLGLDTCGDLLVTSDGPQWDGTFEGGRVPWCPYGKPGDRFIVTRIAAQLMRQGEIIYSPISHTHVMAMQYGLPTDWNYWAENCMAFLNASRKLIVLQQDGWQESIGVQAEMSIARDKGLLIEMMAVD